MMKNKSFEDNFDLLMKGIDKSKNRLVTITDKSGHTKKVWKHIESNDEKEAGKNAGKSYEKTGQRHQSHSGFNSGDAVTFMAGGKEISGTFRHVNQSKHSTVAVVRGEDNKLYERSLNKISKVEEVDEIRPYKNMPKEDLHKLADKKAGRDRANAISELALRYQEKTGRIANVSALDRTEPKVDNYKKLVTTTALGDKVLSNQKNKDGLDVFRNIVKTAKDLHHAFELISKVKNVKAEVSAAFKAKYGSNGERPIEAFENFYNEIKGIKKQSLHIETQKLDKKKNPNFGGKKEDNFTDIVDKTSWQRGDSVSFLDKNGKEKMGRVVKVDKEMNMTTVRQSNGMTETISNKKIKI